MILNVFKTGTKFYSLKPSGSVIVLENLRFNIAEEGKGVNAEGEKV